MKCTIHQAPTGNRLTDAQLFDFERVAHLYDHQDPTKDETFIRRAEAVTGWFTESHRRNLVETLVDYGKRINASTTQLAAAQKLLDSRSVAVVTGQQAGLLTGPFYSISKALSAIGLAVEMERLLGRPVVPVFWVASEDHDFAEVDHAYILNEDDDVTRISLKHQFDTHQMVFYSPLSDTQVREVLDVLRESIPELPYKSEMLHTLKVCWTDGDTLSVWFARVLARLLSKHPIVILDPCLPGLRQLVAPVFARTLRDFDVLQDNLAAAYREVEEAGFAHEVIRDPAHSTVFHVIDGKRYVIEKNREGAFVARGHGKKLELPEWVDLATESPELFSSNVLLRPVIQDHLIPTLAYVGGPSELAYHPLSRAVFHTHERSLPPLIMRQRLRIASPGVWRTMNQWNVSFEDVHEPVDLVARHALQDVAESLHDRVSSLEQTLTTALQGFVDVYEEFGPQVRDIVNRQHRKQKTLLSKLEHKIYRLAERRRSDDVGQLRRIEHWFWTDGHEQERRLCPINVWAELGLTWFESLPTWENFRQPAPYVDIIVE
ncbi:bacillithiol biosynthesis cysteine-adding enzyme BshC [Alicyclobacillus dauci]|uniref:Putative cysteine ligase BshC n=1 Tax=Alicyclobacillus dauci TaxID=1475485 RepID=A0ABY6YYM7_9BACL|nr:bacillithiol biosynthesis cysteine-adding enzyme BshC [Alicyclobacillus dauci]WAH35542.1 bacillithiol biosynthesis cysteine-adding enzyme BshC [Alicyclobacillus dauci]